MNNELKWTDADIDAAYFMGAMNIESIKDDGKHIFPVLGKLVKEIERLKSIGFDKPSDAVRVIRYPNEI